MEIIASEHPRAPLQIAPCRLLAGTGHQFLSVTHRPAALYIETFAQPAYFVVRRPLTLELAKVISVIFGGFNKIPSVIPANMVSILDGVAVEDLSTAEVAQAI